MPERSHRKKMTHIIRSMQKYFAIAGTEAPVVLLRCLGRDGSRWRPYIEPLAKAFHGFAHKSPAANP